MYEYYRGKRVVVTGSSSGIGFATASALISLGAMVIGMSRRRPDLNLAEFHPLDLGSAEGIEAAATRLEGPVDALFNCAGAPPILPSSELVKVNFLGTRLLTERLIDHMGSGAAIVNISSSSGSGWRKRLPVLQDFLATDSYSSGVQWYQANEATAGHGYLFSKEAVTAWTMQQAPNLIAHGIRMNATSPGSVQTPLLELAAAAFPPEFLSATEQPIGRRSTVDEQVEPLLFLNSKYASYVNGAEVAVDGGYQAEQLFVGLA